MIGQAQLKKILERYLPYNSNQLIKKIRNYSWISFDIFDTLIKRSVFEPTDIFAEAAKQLCKTKGIVIDHQVFRSDRIKAEHSARANAIRLGKEEISLAEIYQQLPEHYNHIKDDLQNAEIQAEKDCCHPNPVISKVFHWCKEQGKHIIIISDMYLSQAVIEDILNHCGYSGYEKLYLSSAIGKTKHTGTLYADVLDECGILPKRLVHIGDSFRGDWISAKKHHIKSIHIARRPKRTRFSRPRTANLKDRSEVQLVADMMNGFIGPDWSAYDQYGFEVIGPLLWGFAAWLHDEARKNHIERLFFCARDGYLMQRVYVKIFKEKALPNTYLYISRRSLHVPRLFICLTLDECLSLSTKYRRWEYRTFCEELGIDSKNYTHIWTESGLSLSSQFTTEELLENPCVRSFFERIKNDIAANAKEEFELLAEYLKQEQFHGRIALVDIGWGGSLQKCLNEIVRKSNIQADIFGYYLGMDMTAVQNCSRRSFLPGNCQARDFCTGVFEFPFSSPEGSTQTYRRTSAGTIEPVLYIYEYQNHEKEQQAVLQIQMGALKFVEMLRNRAETFQISGMAAYANVCAATKRPRMRDVELFGDLLFYDGKSCPLAAPESILSYLRRPKKLWEDFQQSTWKIGFMKRLFKLPLPYWTIFKMLRRLEK